MGTTTATEVSVPGESVVFRFANVQPAAPDCFVSHALSSLWVL
jgi:hypothetical protein